MPLKALGDDGIMSTQTVLFGRVHVPNWPL